MKAYKCYGINGYKESIYFTPRHGDAAPDEIEIYLQPYCNEAETFDGKKAIDEITLMSSELEESGIDSVEDIELKFKLIDDNFMNSVESDVITFSAK